MIKKPSDAPRIILASLPNIKIATKRKTLIIVDKDFARKMKNPNGRRYLIRRLCRMIHTEQ